MEAPGPKSGVIAPLFKLPIELRDEIYKYAWDDTRMVYKDQTSKTQLLIIHGTEPFITYHGLPGWTYTSLQFRDESLAYLYRVGRLVITKDLTLHPTRPEYAWKTGTAETRECPIVCSEIVGRITPNMLKQMRRWELPTAQIDWEYHYSNRPCFTLTKESGDSYDPQCCTDYLNLYIKDNDLLKSKLRLLQDIAESQIMEVNLQFRPEQTHLDDFIGPRPHNDETILQCLDMFDALPKGLRNLRVRLASGMWKQEEEEEDWEDDTWLQEYQVEQEEKWSEYCAIHEKCVKLIQGRCMNAMRNIANGRELCVSNDPKVRRFVEADVKECNSKLWCCEIEGTISWDT